MGWSRTWQGLVAQLSSRAKLPALALFSTAPPRAAREKTIFAKGIDFTPKPKKKKNKVCGSACTRTRARETHARTPAVA
jgi:hypothetical protein